MPPAIASVIFTIGIAGLFYLDRDRKCRVSKSLWIPTVWLFICLSRSVSQWLGLSPAGDTATVSVEGSPIDAAVLGALEVLALIVVINRRQRMASVLRKDWPICLFFLYAAFSISWSDFPFVTLKHWIKGVGDVMMVLVVLTEWNVPDAIQRLFTWLGFTLLPLSVLFIKYYPLMGRVLTLSWTMDPVGVATQKNSLGELCDILGLTLLWRFRRAYINREDPYRKRRLVALGAVWTMIIWLLWMCNSMTSMIALSMASAVMLLSATRAFRRSQVLVHLLVVALLAITMYGLFFQSSGSLIQGLGRNPTLTGRTEIWEMVSSIPNNRLIGSGYESFWLGPRLQKMWDAFPGLMLNEAHNGYIEILITLGWVGEVLLGILIAMGYRNVISTYRSAPDLGSLRIAMFLSVIITGFTEAAFRMLGPPWIVFLLAVSGAPWSTDRKANRRERADEWQMWSTKEADAIPEEQPVG